jgi:diaminohydroxyphosphoribosylaminopyrimidine deaminase/5-amino-6-(5-phosphoribosylamino)uracil reductase
MLSLYERGMSAVLWECGGQLAAQAIASGMIQKVVAFIAPKIVGGVHAPSPVGDLGINSMGKALLLERVTVQYIEPDMLMEGYLKLNL